MISCYLRSSALGTLSICEMQFFFTYVLGMKSPSGLAASKGTVFHRVMQVLADKKKAQQEGKKKLKNDDIVDMTFAKCDDIDYVTKICFDHYKKIDNPNLADKDLREITRWVHAALAYNDGELDPRNREIFATELFFDFEIKKDWAKYDYDINGEKISGYLSLKGTVDLIIRESGDYLQVLDYKGLPVDTRIPTPDGWTTMGDLKVGDIVFDQYGRQTKVTIKTEIKEKECYEITFDDTSKVVCDDEHYWKLFDGSVVQIKDLKVKDIIAVAKPIECNEIELPIDPYFLGIWLGDGRNRGAEISSADPFVFEEFTRRGLAVGKNISSRPDKTCEARTVYEMTSSLRKENLLHNKHIPEIYFRASYQQRIDLLRGLMDSDGNANPFRHQAVFMNCNKKLSEDVKHLLLTLGQRPLLSKVKSRGFGLTVDAYPVSFRPININPFLLPRKADKIDSAWGAGASDRRRVTKIEKAGKRKTQCITVDSPDSTYLCTDNFIPTHNTGKRLDWATGKEKSYADLQKDKQLLFYYYALKNIYPDKDFYMSIFYLNDGGLFDLVFDESDYEKAEKMIRNRFEYIRSVELPKQISTDQENWKCKRLCKFSQIHEESGQTTCNHFHDLIQLHGIEKVTADYANVPKLLEYQDGGGRKAKE